MTFAEAERHNAFDLLTELRDHAMVLAPDEKPVGFHLTELALSAAVVAWWTRWQPLAMHRALIAGAEWSEVAAAVGADVGEAFQRWEVWAERQSQSVIAGRVGVGPEEVAMIRSRLSNGAPG